MQDAIEEEGRVYGGGLKKIEPKELAKVSCANFIDLCMVQQYQYFVEINLYNPKRFYYNKKTEDSE